MNTEIQAIHFKADQKLKDFVDIKLQKLETFYEDIIDAQVFLKIENTSVKENKIVEIKLNAKHNTFIQKETSITFEAATDIALEALKVQLKRHKGKLAEH
ncbi:MAG: ribosome-associated translation inhibitor RaiA [Bacteroidetes bacterium]|jgi:putative sigma-54 modulation protein|nr:ribosome-associated translation inhibitor RaiA [Bacteroidota bacterium]